MVEISRLLWAWSRWCHVISLTQAGKLSKYFIEPEIMLALSIYSQLSLFLISHMKYQEGWFLMILSLLSTSLPFLFWMVYILQRFSLTVYLPHDLLHSFTFYNLSPTFCPAEFKLCAIYAWDKRNWISIIGQEYYW